MSGENTKPAFFPPFSFAILAISGGLGYLIFSSDMRLKAEANDCSKFLFALRWQALSCLTLVFSIFRVGFARTANDAIDPMSPEGQRKIEPYSRRLQNTLEQLILSVVGQLVLSTFLDHRNIRVIPGLVLLFVTGRILFFAGYPDQRGPGFMMTFFPTIAVYLANLYFLATSGPLFHL